METTETTIVTHDGKYHTDDLFAVATLLLALDNKARVIRTRDENIIREADYVVDVGGVYDPEKQCFDHHQREGAGVRENGIPYASFGAVWKTYGEEVSGGIEQSRRIDEKLVQPIDAADNGHTLYELNDARVPPYTIQTMLNSFGTMPNEDLTYDDVFMELLPFVQRVLEREIHIAKLYVQAEGDIIRTYEQSEDKQIIVFEKGQEYGRELIGGVLCRYAEPLFAVLYKPDKDTWQTLAIKNEPYSFENRKRLPEEWGGNTTTEELLKLTGFDDVVFVHRAGFMAVSKTKETAIALAKKALEM